MPHCVSGITLTQYQLKNETGEARSAEWEKRLTKCCLFQTTQKFDFQTTQKFDFQTEEKFKKFFSLATVAENIFYHISLEY